jgi:hypothetical protein
MAKNDRARRKRQRSEQTDLLERIKKWSRENRTDGPSGTEVLESPQPPSPCATTIEAAKRSSRAFREALDSAWLPDMTGNPIDPRDPSVQAIDALREEILELLTDERETDEGPSPSNDQPTQPRRKEMSDEDLSERLKAARRSVDANYINGCANRAGQARGPQRNPCSNLRVHQRAFASKRLARA